MNLTSQHPSEHTPNTTSANAKSHAVQAYEWIRARIIDGTFVAGDRIREIRIANDLGISRMPVREALPRLESEGYITTSPRRGAVVSQRLWPTASEVSQVRNALDVLAVRLAAGACADGADPTKLKEYLDAEGSCLASKRFVDAVAASSHLHNEILALSGNPVLQKLVSIVRGLVPTPLSVPSPEDLHHRHSANIQLVEAIQYGQAELAAGLHSAHLEYWRNHRERRPGRS